MDRAGLPLSASAQGIAPQVSGETACDGGMSQAGTFCTASAGDSGHGAEYPAASPNVIAVGGTALNGCSGTSRAGFTSETT